MAPLYASLTARLMALNGTASVQSLFQNGGYYSVLSFNDVTSDNKHQDDGWDPVTGLGSFSSFTQSIKILSKTNDVTNDSVFSPQTSTANSQLVSNAKCFIWSMFIYLAHSKSR